MVVEKKWRIINYTIKYERDGNTKFQFGKFREIRQKSLIDGHVSLNEVCQDPGISISDQTKSDQSTTNRLPSYQRWDSTYLIFKV